MFPFWKIHWRIVLTAHGVGRVALFRDVVSFRKSFGTGGCRLKDNNWNCQMIKLIQIKVKNAKHTEVLRISFHVRIISVYCYQYELQKGKSLKNDNEAHVWCCSDV